MTYPKTWINKTARRVFFYTLVAIFFISAPILLMYSIGYRIDWKNKTLVETGVISIDAKPIDAEVYLSGVKMEKKLPLRLTNRMPGTYNLRLQKTGYKTWEKNIEVKSKQTTYIKDINLLRDMLPVPVFETNDKKIEFIYPSASGNYLVIVSDKNESHLIELLDLQTKDTHQIFRLPQNNTYEINWSPFDDYVLVATDSLEENSRIITMIDADNPNNSKIYTIKKDDYKNNFQWQKDSFSPTVFTRESEYILRLNINNTEKISAIQPSETWYVDSLENIWVSNGNEMFIKSSVDKKNKINISDLNETVEYIIDINDKRAILKTTRNIAVILRENNKIETTNTGSTAYNPATKEWIIWSPWELWSVYENGNIALLNRTSDSISSIFPLDNFGVLIVVNQGGISSFNPGYYVSQTIFKGEVKTASVNQKTKTIYFLGKIGEKENLFELQY